ncbi:MAG: hypothetical protein ABUJ92_00090 [Desulfobacterales bacterium]
MIVDIDVPGWANWAAADKDGELWCYRDRPDTNKSRWYGSNDNTCTYLCGCAPSANWTKELYQVVDGELVRAE